MIDGASNSPDSFFTEIKPLIAYISRKGSPIKKKNGAILKFFKQSSMRF